ncbi:MAG: hypothetical protein AAF291_06340 [Pseudomonadota bacterium]
MKKFTTLASLGALSIALAACGTAEDASTEASPDTVEMAADDALEVVTDEPVADDAADLDAVEGPDAVSEEDATTAADDAAAVAAEAEAAAAAADEVDAVLDDIDEAVEEGQNTLDRIGETADNANEIID